MQGNTGWHVPEPVLVGATKTGWWIAIDHLTVAAHILFEAKDAAGATSYWFGWYGGPPWEIDFPSPIATAHKVTLSAEGISANQRVVFCLYYGTHGVKHQDFMGKVTSTSSQTDSDLGCPDIRQSD